MQILEIQLKSSVIFRQIFEKNGIKTKWITQSIMHSNQPQTATRTYHKTRTLKAKNKRPKEGRSKLAANWGRTQEKTETKKRVGDYVILGLVFGVLCNVK